MNATKVFPEGTQVLIIQPGTEFHGRTGFIAKSMLADRAYALVDLDEPVMLGGNPKKDWAIRRSNLIRCDSADSRAEFEALPRTTSYERKETVYTTLGALDTMLHSLDRAVENTAKMGDLASADEMNIITHIRKLEAHLAAIKKAVK